MQTSPGLTLESFLLWAFSLRIEGIENNVTDTAEYEIRESNFNEFMKDFEHLREEIENALKKYDARAYPDFREYADNIFSFIPDALFFEAGMYLQVATQKVVKTESLPLVKETS